jgi:hypothetical protein
MITGYGHRSSGREPSVHAVCGLSDNGLATTAGDCETTNAARVQTPDPARKEEGYRVPAPARTIKRSASLDVSAGAIIDR